MQRYAHLLIIPVVFFADRWTKALIIEQMRYLSSIEVTSFLSIVHARNYGGAFGFLSQHGASTFIFLVFPIVITVGLIYYLVRYRHPVSLNIALACILAGALGNIYDRLLYGYVTDFVDVYYGKYHWPAFNVADASITCGIGLWMFTQMFGKTRHEAKG
jgi:signal peptidase II